MGLNVLAVGNLSLLNRSITNRMSAGVKKRKKLNMVTEKSLLSCFANKPVTDKLNVDINMKTMGLFSTFIGYSLIHGVF